MNRQEPFDAMQREFESAAPGNIVAIMHQATEDLRRSGIMERVLKTADRVPDFIWDDTHEKSVPLAGCWAGELVVLGF